MPLARSIRPFAIAGCLIAGPAFGQATVGTYYYPWWGNGMTPSSGHTWDETLRAHMAPDDHAPLAGYTSSSNPATIASHIQQSLQANITMWSLSWWGPTSREDNIIRNSILAHPDAHKLEYSIHYESQGRFGDFASPDYSKLQSDFRHLADNVFDDPNYMRIDNRPVVFMYLTREYFDSNAGRQALQDLRAMMQTEYGYDPYIIGDDVFGSNINRTRAALFDAITAYDVYGASGIGSNNGDATQTQVNRMRDIYRNMEDAAEALGINYVPAVSPGFNDKGVRDGHPASQRYLQELGPTAMGSLMEALLEDAALPHTDDGIQNLIMVNSFNEWHEDTQIEATVVRPATNTDDSASGNALTGGKYYEGYGTRYLDLLRQYSSGDVTWQAAGSADGADKSNWSTGFTPRYGDRAVFRSGAATHIDLGAGARWGSILFNGNGATTLASTGTLSLTAPAGSLALVATGGAHHSVINANVTTPGTIRAEMGHDLTFGGAVTAGRIEALSGAKLEFNQSVTATGTGTQAFLTADTSSAIHFHAGFVTTHTGEFGLNGGGAVYFTSYAAPNGTNHVVNLFDSKTVGNLADNTFSHAADLWARTSGVTYDLNGFNQSVEFLGTDAGVVFIIDFGDESATNALDWVASHNMNGTYELIHFTIGADTLRLGSAGPQFFSDAQLAKITINGIAFSAAPLDTPYWNRDADRYVQFHNVPEPASASLLVPFLLYARHRVAGQAP